MRKLLLFVLLLMASPLMGQHIAIINFSQGVNGTTLSNGTDGGATGTIAKSWYGSYGGSANGCSGQVPCVFVQNSTGALTFSNSPKCGPIPPSTGSNIVLDYSTTLGPASNNQIVHLEFPTPPLSGAVRQFVVWFCTDYPSNGPAFGTTGDIIQIVTPNNQISNLNNNGTSLWFALEHGVLAGTHPMPYTPLTWVQLSFQDVVGGTCSDTVNFTDCQREGEFDANGNQIGTFDYGSAGGGTGASEITLGNGNNGPTMAAGFHFQFGAVKMCLFGCTLSMFPMKFTPAPPWEGIVARNRAMDYTKAGIAGGIPSSGWPQCITSACNTALAAGTAATTAQINAALTSAAGSNTHVDIAGGTYNFSTGQITYPTSGHVELRALGNGADFVFSGTAGGSCNRSGSAFICQVDASNANITGNPTLTWTSGYTQGTTATVLSNGVGINTTASANPTLLVYNQCDTGLQGNLACSVGTNTDNGNLFISEQLYNAGVGCCGNGPGNTITNRGEAEIHVATSTSGSLSSNVTLSIPISNPNYATVSQPAVLPIQSVSMFGLNNIRVKDPQVGAAVGISFQNAYNWWVVGGAVTDSNAHLTWGFNCLGCVNGEFQSNYVYKISGNANPYGVRCMMCSYNLWDNNIIQSSTTPFSFDGSSVGNVIAYNFVPNAPFNSPSNVNQASFNSHAINLGDVYDSNLVIEYVSDGIHGTQGFINNFRNGYLGWWSQPATPVTSTTNARQEASFSRYSSDTFGLYGASLYHTIYFQNASCTTASKAIFLYGVNCAYGNVPTDSLSGTTALRYGNYDIKTAAVRFCGNALNTNFSSAGNCNSVSEAPAAASTYPNFVPAVGDTTAGQPAAPASFYFSARPSWYSNSIPFPAMGPDVTGGNLGQCGGTINTVGQFAGMPATSAAQCAGQGLNTLWGGHANAIPAAVCAYQLGMPPDGSGSELAFNYNFCYSGTVLAPIASFSPSTANVGQVPLNLTSNPSGPYTLTNIGTANLVNTSITLPNSLFSIVSNTCGSPATITSVIPGTGFTLTPGQFCTFNVTATPTAIGGNTANAVFIENTVGGSDILALSATGTGTPSPSTIMFAGLMADHTLCPVVPATTQLCYSIQCACMWISMKGGAYIPMGVSSVNGQSGKVTLLIPSKAVSTTTTVIQ